MKTAKDFIKESLAHYQALTGRRGMYEHDGCEHGLALAVFGEDAVQKDLKFSKENGEKERMAEAAGLWLQGGCLLEYLQLSYMLYEPSPPGIPDSHEEYFLLIDGWCSQHPEVAFDFVVEYYASRNS